MKQLGDALTTRRGVLRAGAAIGQLATGCAIIAAATGCGSVSTAVPPAPNANALTGRVSLLVRTNNNEQRFQNESVVPAIRQQFPNLTVEVNAVGSGTDYQDKWTAMVASGTPPEVFSSYGVSFPDY
jgi:ABC-type glycerol-3-phosphate transport system substrate-binding protein